MTRHAVVLPTLLALLLATVAPLPLRAQRIAEEDLFAKSLRVAQRALEQYGRYDDPEQTRRLNDIGYRVARESGFTEFPFTFHLIDMPAPNAFALPGGHIFITRGMLELGLSDDMLAALLGHEVAHVVEEHFKEMRRKATLMNVLSQVLMAGVMIAAEESSSERRNRYNPYDPRNHDPNQGDLVKGAAAASLVVSELLMRSYSRDNETEADQEGLRWAAGAGFDPAGAADLMRRMGSRIPQSKEYGYWMTHPFFDERVRGAEALAKHVERQPEEEVAEFRSRTQATLLTYLEEGDPPEEAVELLETQALDAWPQGPAAERLRLATLHELRESERAKGQLQRDYGMLIRAYRQEAIQVRFLTPDSDFLGRLDAEIDALDKQRDDLYPKARAVLEEGVYETSFLDNFLSNFPDAPEAARTALELGDSYSRLGEEAEAVRLYLRAWEAAPESPEGKRAARGLAALAPRLEGLAALQQLALQRRDPELATVAEERLSSLAGTFDDIDNGAEYLHRFPEAPHTEQVIDRINHLADDLYGEVVLYQAVGDNVKAVERINKILTHAPTSRAAQRLRDRAVFDSEDTET